MLQPRIRQCSGEHDADRLPGKTIQLVPPEQEIVSSSRPPAPGIIPENTPGAMARLIGSILMIRAFNGLSGR